MAKPAPPHRENWHFAARSVAGVGCGEGFPLPVKDDAANRTAIRSINSW